MSVADVIAGRTPWTVKHGDALQFLESLPDDCVHCCATSPPYFGLRDYQCEGQIGLEKSVEEYVAALVRVFRAFRRALHPSGTLWLNLGDSYAATGKSGGGEQGEAWREAGAKTVGPRGGAWSPAPVGYKPKDRLMVPARVALALQADGWWLRDEIIWDKPSPMPSSVTDRTTCSHEMVYLLAKRPRYFFDNVAIAEPAVTAGRPVKEPDGWDTGEGSHGSIHRGGRSDGRTLGAVQPETRNPRSVWRISTKPYKEAHFATFPPDLAERMVLAGTSAKGVCPACGSPWRRLVKKDRKPTRPGKDTKCTAKGDGDAATADANGWNRPNVIGNRDPQRHCTTTETVGWEPTCGCGRADTLPALVCDPFMGSGTVAEVAVSHGRRAVGSELNEKYVGLIRQRMAKVTGQSPGMEDAA